MARFFCDHCGKEVQRNSSRCPSCGRYFGFVRCPQCGYTAEATRFAKGCPQCGYCTPELERSIQPVQKEDKPILIMAGKLPLWVYIAAVLGLAAVVLVLYFLMKRPVIQ